MLETGVDSFIVRFVREISRNAGPSAAPWHGVTRHLQSKEEMRFTQIEEALHFVANYVELATNSSTQNDTTQKLQRSNECDYKIE